MSLRCATCGKFISYDDMSNGAAITECITTYDYVAEDIHEDIFQVHIKCINKDKK